ncbi:ionotropic receptor 93a-like isoform X2 [Rhipicephalus microplus]|uniref:ionotropic receptor 93a-like isoform X2 n=1 Tax=Rhipicephalus microplus TaxID=6941 RepID=UPI003F6B72BC
MAITYHRIQLAHFTPQVLTEYLTILAGFPDEMEVNAFGTLMVFEWEVWVVLFCSLLVCVMASVLADATSCIHRTNKPMCKLVRQNWWAYTSAMFMEPPMHTPDSSPGRLVLGAWWLTILVLMNAFTGHIKAIMMLLPDPVRIDSFTDLSQREDITPILWKGGAYEDFLKRATDVEEYRGVWNLVIRRDGLRDEAKLYDDENLRMVLEGKAVILSDVTTLTYHASRTCRRPLAAGRYYLAKESTFPHPLTMASHRSNNPTLREFIDKRVGWLFETGVLKAWIEKQLGDWQSCLFQESEENYSALSLSDVQSVFFLFLTFASFSIIVFISELLIGAYMLKSRKRNVVRRIKWVPHNRRESQRTRIERPMKTRPQWRQPKDRYLR